MDDASTGVHRSGANLVASLVGRDDSRVIRALEEYIEALERGGPADREQFLARHAAVAGPLRACLEGIDLVRSAAVGFATESHRPGPAGLPAPIAAPGRLGDYQILREVGRGGMGVVYEAVQVSLGRRVALKVLPTALAAEPRQLQRFRVEAQAAAQLHHSNIVPVFSVGCDQNVHYYAMQYIDGPSLADVIRGLRAAAGASAADPSGPTRLEALCAPATPTNGRRLATPAPAQGEAHDGVSSVGGGQTRWHAVARLGVQAARALDHAHGLGIVHRDIKPANLMIDRRGNLWVTDFGLARLQDEAGLTITGDLLGTLRYMSPEQASGRRAVIDHRADIYALGTTLYELLTLRPAVVGRDRHDLIRQITHDDPPRPRRLVPGLPRELETIVLKAMAREPTERYGTAGELADDLQRYLDDKPIQARPPTLLDCATKWARRHKPWVAAAACLLLGLAGFFAVSTVLIARERDQAQAKHLFAEAKHQAALERLRKARRAMDALYGKVIEKAVPLNPEEAREQVEFLRIALEHYSAFAREEGDDPASRRDAALAYRRVGDIQYRLGRFAESELAYRHGLQILEQLALDPSARGLGIPEHAALTCRSLGRLLQAAIRDQEAETVFRRAIVLQGQQAGPGDAATGNAFLATLHLDLGLLLGRSGRRAEAQEQLGAAVGLAERAGLDPRAAPEDREVSQALLASIRSHVHESRGRIAEASDEARRACILARQLAERHPDQLEARSRQAHAYFRLAWLLGTTGVPGVRDTAEAVRLARKAVALEPQNAQYHHKLGALLIVTDDTTGAEREFRAVLAMVPDSPDAHNSLAWLLATRENPSRRDLREAVELATRAVAEARQVGLYWNTLGVAHYQSGDAPRAIAALEQSMALRGGGDSFDWFFLAMAHWRLGRVAEARQWLDKASAWMSAHRPNDLELRRFAALAMGLIEGRPDLAKGQRWPRPDANDARPTAPAVSGRIQAALKVQETAPLSASGILVSAEGASAPASAQARAALARPASAYRVSSAPAPAQSVASPGRRDLAPDTAAPLGALRRRVLRPSSPNPVPPD
jgi:serine/threonine protein kinase/Tfp pilus assembly protein PilF